VKYHRTKAPGSAFFFTVVTFNCQKIFTDEQTVAQLRRSIAVAMRAGSTLNWLFGNHLGLTRRASTDTKPGARTVNG
jgi:hypothetical protein